MFLTLPVLAQTPGIYNPGDVAVINDMIDYNGLQWTKADPADGSYIPDGWTGAHWSDGETDKRIIILDIANQSLTGDLDVSKLTGLQELLCSSWIIIENSNSNDPLPPNSELNNEQLNRLTSLNASGCSNLRQLDCIFNMLTSLDVSACTELEVLECTANQLEELNVAGLTHLKRLSCNNNNLTSLIVTGCTGLEQLYCTDNSLASLDVSGLISLSWLFCSNNSLSSINMSGLSGLQWLFCGNNDFTSLDVSELTGLERFSCEVNRLTSLDVSGLSNLRHFNCAYNNLTSLVLTGCAALQELICSYNNLASIDLSGLTGLSSLNCMENKLTDLELSGLTSLEYLYCSNNSLTKLTVLGLTDLNTLFCTANQLTFLDLTGMNNLVYFEGHSQTLSLLFTGSDNHYTANIVFGDGVTFDTPNLSYENDLLTITSDETLSFDFTSPTVQPDIALTGTITAAYETIIIPANDPLARICNSCLPLKTYVQNGRLHVSGLHTGEPWRVYRMSGALIYRDTATGSEANISLPARGLYIVQSGDRTVKIYLLY